VLAARVREVHLEPAVEPDGIRSPGAGSIRGPTIVRPHVPSPPMVASHDIAARQGEIKLLIASDDIDRAAKRAMDFVRDFSDQRDHLNEVIVISASYTHLSKQERQGLLDFDQVEKHRRKLLFQMLSLLDAIESALAGQMMAA
jgi:hypothetical protein